MGFNIKNYTLVNDRLNAFLSEYPEATIETSLLSRSQIVDTSTGEECNEYIVQAKITPDPIQKPEAFTTGIAAERDNTGFVNKTSALENCETSAVGRALGFLGYGSDTSIASQEEVVNAQTKQKAINPTIKSLEEIDSLARQCHAKKLINDDQYKGYNEKRGAGFYDTKLRVSTANTYFSNLLKGVENVK